jgi:hypothetical protein
MNEEVRQKAHTSFVEIIKQLSPFDAQNLKYLFQNPNTPVGQIRLMDNDKTGSIGWVANFFPFPKIRHSNHQLYSASVENLVRLGLIQLDWMNPFVHPTMYDALYSHLVFKDCEQIFASMPDHKNFVDRHIILGKGSWKATDFGVLFSQCCF